MTEKRFINDIDIGQLIDTKGELSTIDYSDTVDFYELWEFLNKLNDENEQLKKELQIYHKLASCNNCDYHDYDEFENSDGSYDEFEVCRKGNDVTERICENWKGVINDEL